MKNSALIVGLDGATWNNLNPYIKSGKLPFLKKLKQTSSYGKLETTIPSVTAPAWSSFQTGVNPGKHGIFGFLNFKKNPLNPPLFTSKDVKSEKIWDLVGRYNHQSLIMNMPLTYPIKPINGILISSFLTPKGEKYAYPDRVYQKLKTAKYKVESVIGKKEWFFPNKKISPSQQNSLIKRYLKEAKARVTAFKKLYRQGNYSLAFLLLKETDNAQHLLFNKPQLADFYQQIDKLLKNLFNFYQKHSPAQPSFMVISDHGFHPTAKIQFSFYAWLKQQGFFKNQEKLVAKSWRQLSRINQTLKKLNLSLTNIKSLNQAREKLVALAEKQTAEKLAQLGIKATNEGIYFYGSNKNRLKLKQNSIIKKLQSLKYKGQKVFKQIKPAATIYKGNYKNSGPDIVWLFQSNFCLNSSGLAADIFSSRPTPLQGNHLSQPDGIYLFKGQPFKTGPGKRLKLYDIFPLVCYLLNCPLPENLDGQVPKNVLKKYQAIKTEKQTIESLVNSQIKKLQSL